MPCLTPSRRHCSTSAPGHCRGSGAATAVLPDLPPTAAASQAGLAALLASMAMLVALLLTAGWSPPVLGQEVPLQCRLGTGPWLPCRMEVQDMGLHWFLTIGTQRIEFRHSGDGAVRMQKGAEPWQPVTAQWQSDASLCWDGVCAKGAIPLD